MLPGTDLLADAEALTLEKNSGKNSNYGTELGKQQKLRGLLPGQLT